MVPSQAGVDQVQALGGVRVQAYRQMARIRAFEECAANYFRRGLVPGFIHSSVGQEAAAVGFSSALKVSDYMTSTHRGHGHLIAKGADLRGMAAEVLGRATGLCQGRGGSMHIVDSTVGALGANGIVGSGIPIAAGAGLGIQQRGGSEVVMCFFGDGAVNTGAFHEGMNLAAIWDLPVVYVCENNQYAESTPWRSTVKVARLSERSQGYGIPGVTVDGNDLEECMRVGAEAVERARAGEGPTLVEALTYRWYGHHTGDPGPYRSGSEVEEWKQRDPLARARHVLVDSGEASEEELGQIEQDASAEAEAAFAEAAEAPLPKYVRVSDHLEGQVASR